MTVEAALAIWVGAHVTVLTVAIVRLVLARISGV